jgi:hypothetical protein
LSFNPHHKRAMPGRRVGRQRQFWALYGATSPADVLLAMLQNARPTVRPGVIPLSDRMTRPGRANFSRMTSDRLTG